MKKLFFILIIFFTGYVVKGQEANMDGDVTPGLIESTKVDSAEYADTAGFAEITIVDGQGTTANGNAADLGGSYTEDLIISSSDGNSISVATSKTGNIFGVIQVDTTETDIGVQGTGKTAGVTSSATGTWGNEYMRTELKLIQSGTNFGISIDSSGISHKDSNVPDESLLTDNHYVTKGNIPGVKVDSAGFSDTASYYKLEAETVSRTIYVDPTGSDDNGDGSIGSPFAGLVRAVQDIKTVIPSGVVITIHMNAGTYNYENDSLEAEFTRLIKYGLGQLVINSDMVLQTSGFTLTARSPEVYIYDVSGATFTTNEHQDRFLLNGGKYYPIAHNNTAEIYAWEGQAAATSIYAPGVTLVMQTKFLAIGSPKLEAGEQSVTFNNIKFSRTGDYITSQLSAQVEFNSCHFDMQSMQLPSRILVQWKFTNCLFTSRNTVQGIQLGGGAANNMKECILRKIGDTGGIGINVNNGANLGLNGFYVYNYTTGMSVGISNVFAPFGASEWIVDSCTNAVALKNGSHISTGTRASIQLFLRDVDYGIAQANANAELMGNYSCHFYDVVGSPDVAWLTSDLSANGYIDIAKGISILIPDVTELGIQIDSTGMKDVGTLPEAADYTGAHYIPKGFADTTYHPYRKYEAAAFLHPDSTITTSISTTWIFLGDGDNNKFSNIETEGFSFDGDTLQFDQFSYDTRDSIEFHISYSCESATSSVNKTIYNGIFIKEDGESTYVEQLQCTRRSRTTSASTFYPGPMLTTMPIWLKDGDKIQIQAKCDGASTTLSTESFGIYLYEE